MIMIGHSQTMQGSYRLHTAPFQIQINAQDMIVNIFHMYVLGMVLNTATKGITLSLSAIEEGQQFQLDRRVLQILEMVNRFEVGGSMLRFYDKQDNLLFRGRREDKNQQINNGIEGKWSMEPITLPIQVRNGKFQFQGIKRDNNVLNYYVFPQNRIAIILPQKLTEEEEESQKKQLIAEKMNSLFIQSLLKARTYKLGQVSFQLFDQNNRLVALGSPYL